MRVGQKSGIFINGQLLNVSFFLPQILIEMKIFVVYLQVVIQHSALFRNVAFENGDTTFHMLKTIQMVKSQKHFFSTSSI